MAAARINMESRCISLNRNENTSYTEISLWPGNPLILEISTRLFQPLYLFTLSKIFFTSAFKIGLQQFLYKCRAGNRFPGYFINIHQSSYGLVDQFIILVIHLIAKIVSYHRHFCNHGFNTNHIIIVGRLDEMDIQITNRQHKTKFFHLLIRNTKTAHRFHPCLFIVK